MTGSPKEQGILTLAGTSKLGLALSVFEMSLQMLSLLELGPSTSIQGVVLHEPGGNVKSI